MTGFRALCAELADRLQRAITSSKADRFYGEDRDALDRARAALAQPELEGPTAPTRRQILMLADELAISDLGGSVRLVQEALRLWGRPAVEPVSERFEFSVLDCEHEEQAGGTAPTYSQALSEGQHYLAMYSQDGPHSLELRRVEVLPIPNQEAGK